MSSITDNLFADVCLDERVTDGIFKMDEETHMDALRDHLVKRGISLDVVKEVSNKMLGEGNYPDRQAWRKEDGILVTWPSANHMKLAFQKNPNKYTTQAPPKQAPAQPQSPAPQPPAEKPAPEEPEGDEEKPSGGGNVFGGGAGPTSKISQGGKELEVEPPKGMEKTALQSAPAPEQTPRTPERVAAEKEVVKQIFATDDHALANITPPMNEQCRHQLNELYKQADMLGYTDAITFLTPLVKP